MIRPIHTYKVTVNVDVSATIPVDVYVNAENEDQAYDLAREQDVTMQDIIQFYTHRNIVDTLTIYETDIDYDSIEIYEENVDNYDDGEEENTEEDDSDFENDEEEIIDVKPKICFEI